MQPSTLQSLHAQVSGNGGVAVGGAGGGQAFPRMIAKQQGMPLGVHQGNNTNLANTLKPALNASPLSSTTTTATGGSSMALFIVVLDATACMKTYYPHMRQLLENILRSFMEKCKTQNKTPNYALVWFRDYATNSDFAVRHTQFTTDVSELKYWLDVMSFSGGWSEVATGDALATAAKLLQRKLDSDATERHVLLFSNSFPIDTDVRVFNESLNVYQVAERLGKSGVCLSVVCPRNLDKNKDIFEKAACNAPEERYETETRKDNQKTHPLVLLRGITLKRLSMPQNAAAATTAAPLATTVAADATPAASVPQMPTTAPVRSSAPTLAPVAAATVTPTLTAAPAPASASAPAVPTPAPTVPTPAPPSAVNMKVSGGAQAPILPRPTTNTAAVAPQGAPVVHYPPTNLNNYNLAAANKAAATKLTPQNAQALLQMHKGNQPQTATQTVQAQPAQPQPTSHPHVTQSPQLTAQQQIQSQTMQPQQLTTQPQQATMQPTQLQHMQPSGQVMQSQRQPLQIPQQQSQQPPQPSGATSMPMKQHSTAQLQLQPQQATMQPPQQTTQLQPHPNQMPTQHQPLQPGGQQPSQQTPQQQQMMRRMQVIWSGNLNLYHYQKTITCTLNAFPRSPVDISQYNVSEWPSTLLIHGLCNSTDSTLKQQAASALAVEFLPKQPDDQNFKEMCQMLYQDKKAAVISLNNVQKTLIILVIRTPDQAGKLLGLLLPKMTLVSRHPGMGQVKQTTPQGPNGPGGNMAQTVNVLATAPVVQHQPQPSPSQQPQPHAFPGSNANMYPTNAYPQPPPGYRVISQQQPAPPQFATPTTTPAPGPPAAKRAKMSY